MPFKFSKEQMSEMRELFDSGSVAAIITVTNYSGTPEGIAAIRLLHYNNGSPCGPSIFINAGRSSAGLISEGYVFSTFSMACTMLTIWGLDVYHPDVESKWRLFTPEEIDTVNVYHYEDALDLLTRSTMARYYKKEETASTMAPMSPPPPHHIPSRIQSVSSGIHPGATSAAGYNRRPAQPSPAVEPLRSSKVAEIPKKQPVSKLKTFDQMIHERVLEKLEESACKAKEKSHNRKIQAAIDDFEKYPDHEDIY